MKQFKYSLILLFIAFIWGLAFSFQSLGGQALGTFTFYSFRSYCSVVMMFILLAFKKDKKILENTFSIKIGIVGGVITCVA